ncbi:MAG: hypothetical protein M3Q23_03835 [Actinomycetota bacterium]|nr:hypothetical protein [Actinomycetota bacterium]
MIAATVWAARRARRTRDLRSTFGPEYDRTVQSRGSRQDAESELQARRRRREQLTIRPLAPEERERYRGEWQAVQSRFVDQPGAAVREADLLVTRVMRDRGYPMEQFEQRAADVSVDHPNVVQNYRSAHAIHIRMKSGDESTEALRQAMVHYRALFAELLEMPDERGQTFASQA